MFKTKEELEEGKRGLICVGIRDAFISFAKRIEFYRKYRSNFTQFDKDYPNICRVNNYIEVNESYFLATFNNWLFDYCFKDVLE